MRKLKILLLVISLCVGLLVIPAAASSATQLDSSCTVDTDGSCHITVRLQLSLDEETKELRFPLPAQARQVQLGGWYKTPTTDSDRLWLPLGRLNAGSHTLDISYELPSLLVKQGGAWMLELPLLSGFAYPIESLHFSVTLPGSITAEPEFSSDYYGLGIQSGMSWTVQDSSLSGSTGALMELEQLTLKLKTDLSLFPDFDPDPPLLGLWETILLVLIAVATVYYLIALLPSLPRRESCTLPPEGISAGELGTCLTGCGTDLTMMVFTWAHLGYLRLEPGSGGRIFLCKRMEMGNERSLFENQCFRELFSQQERVDGTGLRYARLCQKLAGKSALRRQLYKSTSGNPRLFMIPMAVAGACSGIMLSRGFYTAGAGSGLLAMLLFALCGGLSWLIQSGGRSLPLSSKRSVWLALGSSALWLLLGWLAGQFALALAMVALQVMTGLVAAVGGRRSEMGRRSLAQIRGLRHHLTRASLFDLQQYLLKNPDYFFEMLPYALALGVDKHFARRFGKTKLTECSYFLLPSYQELNAVQWAAVLHQAADCLNRRQRRLQWEQLLQTVIKQRR